MSLLHLPSSLRRRSGFDAGRPTGPRSHAKHAAGTSLAIAARFSAASVPDARTEHVSAPASLRPQPVRTIPTGRAPFVALRSCVAALFGVAGSFCWSAGPARALDGSASPADEKPALPLFKTPTQALRQAMDGYRSGNVKLSLQAFEYAAANGNPLARWKLGKMYAVGDGVAQDDYKAFKYFSQIVQNYDEDDVDRRDLSVVSNAFVAVGVYRLNGIANSEVKPEPERAFEMFQYAAMNFGNADAQYNLARLYLDGGTSVARDPRQAVRWLALAADKSHLPAQALLGHMLFNGSDGISNQRARGLMWLTIARDAALASKDSKNAWIVDLFDKAMGAASESDRQIALVYLEDHRKRD